MDSRKQGENGFDIMVKKENSNGESNSPMELGNVYTRRKKRGSSKIRCYNCKELRHYAKECKKCKDSKEVNALEKDPEKAQKEHLETLNNLRHSQLLILDVFVRKLPKKRVD